MKRRHALVVVTLCCIFLPACDPPDKDIFITDEITIRGTIDPQDETIHLGDTIRLTFELPDTVNINSHNYSIQSVQEAHFYMGINKIDTVRKLPLLIKPPAFWTFDYGSVSPTNSSDFLFEKSRKPCKVKIAFKPTERGIYYLDVLSQPGKLVFNNSMKAVLYVNFNVPDKHLYVAVPYFGQDWADNVATRPAGMYVFSVR